MTSPLFHASMPQVPAPETLPDLREVIEAAATPLPPAVQRFSGRNSPFEFRAVQPVSYLKPSPQPPRFDVWFRTVGAMDDDPLRHACLLAYVSDYHLIATAMHIARRRERVRAH